jgi:UDP:flavonoid glycosyltransferase YjiC (YdhE family)
MVLLPWDADQPGVAARAEALGVAAVVPRDAVSTESMVAAVTEVLGEDRYRTTAQSVAGDLSERSPAREACLLIEAL